MPKVSPECLKEVNRALSRYLAEVDDTRLAPTSKQTYLTHAENFVRWLEDEFEPGGAL